MGVLIAIVGMIIIFAFVMLSCLILGVIEGHKTAKEIIKIMREKEGNKDD